MRFPIVFVGPALAVLLSVPTSVSALSFLDTEPLGLVATLDASASTAVVHDVGMPTSAPVAADIQEVVAPAPADVQELPDPDARPSPAADVPEDTEQPAVPQPTEKVPETPEEVGKAVAGAIEAAQEGEWSALAGFLIMLVVWVARKVGVLGSLKGWLLPWIALLMGGAGTFAAYLASGYSMPMALLYAFFAGGQAIAFWELVFKHIDRELAKEG